MFDEKNAKCYIFAGVNGSGKTTFSKLFLTAESQCQSFINADLIAYGISPLNPEKNAVNAGRLMIRQIDECVKKHKTFAFETTLSGTSYAKKIMDWKNKGYKIIIYYFKLDSVEFAIQRVKLRVFQGGHNIPELDIRRRFARSWENFQTLYKPLANSWIVFNNTGNYPVIIEKNNEEDYAEKGLRALMFAAVQVGEDAIRYNYKVPISKDGKIIFGIPEVPEVPEFYLKQWRALCAEHPHYARLQII